VLSVIKCNAINTITLENGEPKKQVQSHFNRVKALIKSIKNKNEQP
jgi:hypothetical protein